MEEFITTTRHGSQKKLLLENTMSRKTKKSNAVTTKVETWTPEMAKAAIAKGGANRKVVLAKSPFMPT